jgi:cell division protein FtsL
MSPSVEIVRCIMRNLPAVFYRRALLLFIATIASAFALTATARAQSASDAERARRMAERDQAFREWQMRKLGKIKKVDIEVEPTQISLAKVKEDYEGLQRANNEILAMLSTGKEIDYKVVFDASSQIRKRAGRLKSYIVALELGNDDKERRKNSDEIDATEMRSSLLSLDASILSLIKSPVFKYFGNVVDTESSTRALYDLDSIIALSERIKRSVERSLKSRASR